MNSTRLRGVDGDFPLQKHGAAIEGVPARPKDWLAHTVDFFDSVMSDLAVLVMLLSLFVLWSLFMLRLTSADAHSRASEDVFAAQRVTAEATSTSQGYVPFRASRK
jgi:hypothetical protein